jgi:hypothetical protein
MMFRSVVIIASALLGLSQVHVYSIDPDPRCPANSRVDESKVCEPICSAEYCECDAVCCLPIFTITYADGFQCLADGYQGKPSCYDVCLGNHVDICFTDNGTLEGECHGGIIRQDYDEDCSGTYCKQPIYGERRHTCPNCLAESPCHCQPVECDFFPCCKCDAGFTGPSRGPCAPVTTTKASSSPKNPIAKPSSLRSL